MQCEKSEAPKINSSIEAVSHLFLSILSDFQKRFYFSWHLATPSWLRQACSGGNHQAHMNAMQAGSEDFFWRSWIIKSLIRKSSKSKHPGIWTTRVWQCLCFSIGITSMASGHRNHSLCRFIKSKGLKIFCTTRCLKHRHSSLSRE
jgi:hypothetical protein